MVTVRPARPDALEFMQRMLYEAANRPGQPWPAFAESINEDRNRRFWVDWMREGDMGVIAEAAGRAVGAAWIRRLSPDEAGEHYDPAVPVLAIAVEAGFRGQGVGGLMMGDLITTAAAARVQASDLATGSFNTAALSLYRSHGFNEMYRLGDAVRMRLTLTDQ